MNKLKGSEELLCCYEIDSALMDSDMVNLVSLRKDGLFQEHQEETVVSSLKIRFPVNGASRIQVFYSYKPYCKYYLISLDSELIILKKYKVLEFFQRIQKVSHYEITDPQNTGIPQIMIYFKDKKTKLTDLSECQFEIESLENINIKSQINCLKTSNKKIQNLLQDKIKFIARFSGVDDLISPPSHDFTYEIKPKTFLSPEKLILKIYNNKWIIIFKITNTQEKPLCNFEVFGNYLIYNTFLYTNFTKIKTLHPGESCHVVGIMEEPIFETDVFMLDISLNFSAGDLFQHHVGQLAVNVSDIVLGKYVIAAETVDVIALISVGLENELSLAKNCEDELQTFLKSRFEEVKPNVYINIKASYFKNCVIIYKLKRNFCHIKFYVKELNQFIVLVKSLNEFSINFDNIPNQLYAKEALCTMKDELDFYKNLIFQKIEDNIVLNDDEIQHKIALHEIYSAVKFQAFQNKVQVQND